MSVTTSGMTPQQFVEKWSRAQLSERAASQEHFIDLCRLLGQPTPAEADATGDDYCFEKHVRVVGSASKGSKGEGGFVDVWKRGCFAWEYKQQGKYKTLDEAYRQLYQYRDALDNPPLSIVCDIATTEIRTHFPGYPTQKETIPLAELPAKLHVLRRAFTDPDSFRATLKTTETVTQELAKEFGDLADRLIDRYPPDNLAVWESAGSPVAHFLMKVMFCLFAEDIGLLPDQAFTKLINLSLLNPENFEADATTLFKLMATGGRFGFDTIPYFNGGLFDDAPALPLKHGDLTSLRRVAGDNQNWAGVEPSIFGTVFERILDPKKRAQIGAHYTSQKDILLVVEPVVMAPLRRRWQAVQDELAAPFAAYSAEKDRKKREFLSAPIRLAVENFRQHLAAQRVLDPACGSGNFLYVTLKQLLELENEAVRFCARAGVDLDPTPRVRPTQMHGIEINRYAAELAQVVIWIGYLQWMHDRGIENEKRPILDKLQTIENRDAILDSSDKKHPAPAKWPEADFIVGNPPFLGSSKFQSSGIPESYKSAIEATYGLRGKVDLCCYWFERSLTELRRDTSVRVGLLGNTTIRFGVARDPLDRIVSEGRIFHAWSNHEWVQDGAKVRTCIACFTFAKAGEPIVLDAVAVERINADLTASIDVTAARRLHEDDGISFEGDQKGGPFDIEWDHARTLMTDANPIPETNDAVLRPRMNAVDVTRRWAGGWVIDFGSRKLEESASFAAPLQVLKDAYKAEDEELREKKKPPKVRRTNWWLHKCARPKLLAAIGGLSRYLVTGRVATHRTFKWLPPSVLPDSRLFAFARSDDYFFGVLQSSVHERWALSLAPPHGEGNDPTYSATTCFETFPLPWPPGKEDTAHPAYGRIAAAAKALNEQRERWLNPPEWLDPLAAAIDAADTFADVPAEARPLVRQSAIMAAAAKDARLKKRTLTNLYNERPTWLKLAHEQLDRAVLAAYVATNPAPSTTSTNSGQAGSGQADWSEDWAEVWTDTGAGQPLPKDHPLAAKRAETDQRVLSNLLRLNHARAAAQPSAGDKPESEHAKAAKPAKPTPDKTAKKRPAKRTPD